VDVSRDCPKFLSAPIISDMGKATNFKFCMHIHRIDRNKSPLKISAKVAVGVLRPGLWKFFRAAIYRAYRAVIFAVAQLSCSLSYSLTMLTLHKDSRTRSHTDHAAGRPLA